MATSWLTEIKFLNVIEGAAAWDPKKDGSLSAGQPGVMESLDTQNYTGEDRNCGGQQSG